MLLLVTSLAQFASVQPAAAQSCIVTTPIGSGNEEGLGVVIQPDGKILVVGFTDVGAGNLDIAVVRYDSSFGLDTSFDVDGKVTTPIGAANETAVDVALQPDGKIVVVGFSDVGAGNNDFAVVRYNPNGSLDTSFDVDGKVTTGIGGDDQARSVAIQPDGKIVVAGWSFFGGRYQFAAARYNPNGSLDATFDTDGIVTTALGAVDDKGYSVAIQPDGKIVVAGETNNGANFDYGVVRYNPNGSLDATFDVDGRVTTDIGANGDFGRSVSLQTDGKIVVTGTTTIAGSLDFGAVRYNPNGSLDTTFDGDGKVSTPVGSSNEFQFAGALQLDGKIVTAGHSDVGAANFDVAVVRYNPNGSLDTSFSGDGKVTTPIGQLDDRGHALAIQPDGKIVVAGSSNNGSNFDFSVVRYHPDGSLDATCGTCASGGTWWNYTWGRRRKLSFDNSGQAQNLSGFPVLVKLDSTRIDYARTQNAGQDIRFVDANDQTLLDHEIELWNEAGASYVWVRVPQIDASSGADFIYMYYDNATALDAQNAAGVWSGYGGVWHLKENPAGAPPQMKDSTANLNHGTAENALVQTPGQIDGSLAFVPNVLEQNVNVPNSASLQLPTNMTVSAWVRTTSADAQARVVIAKWNSIGSAQNYWLGKLNAGTFNFYVDSAQNVGIPLLPLGLINNGAWHHVVGVADASAGLLRLYVDGTQQATAPYTGTSQTGISELRIGRNPDNILQDWDGGIDEVRVFNGARSVEWIRAQYLSTSDVFIAYGAETGACFLRSIGTAANRSTATGDGTVTATNGSSVVTGSGTLWKTWTRGRGDVITIDGTNYVVLGVGSETQLLLTSPFAGTSGSGKSYTMVRQFTTLPAWEDCVDGPPGAPCPFFPVTSASLVSDDRSEVGIAYKDSVFTAGAATNVVIDGSTTDALHTITLTADPGNRHNGIAGNGVILDGGAATDSAVLVLDDFVTVEWLEIRGGGAGFDGVEWQSIAAVNKGVARNLLIHNLPDTGIQIQDSAAIVDIYNNILYRNGRGIRNVSALTTGTLRIFNNTVFGSTSTGGITASVVTPGLITLRNNIAHSNVGGGGDFNVPSPNAASSHNLASDTTGTTHSPAGGGIDSQTLAQVNFFSTTPGLENLHINAGSTAADQGADLGSIFTSDIDGVIRLTPWEIGADDISQTTAVTLQSFTASGTDAAVELSWSTASELSNLGFHVYRSLSAEGPYERITSSLIPGLGSSPTGASYSYRDNGLLNGQTYYYQLEDVETTGKAELHGPVWATPMPGADDGSGGGDSGSGSGSARITYGQPEEASFRIVERGSSYVLLELLTPGFYAVSEGDGTVHLEVPGFSRRSVPGAPDVPVKRALVEALAGRGVRLASAVASDEVRFDGLRVAAAEAPELVVTDQGMVKAGLTRKTRTSRPGLFPRIRARVLEVIFQGETKKVHLELAPLRYNPGTGRTVLTQRLLVRLDFTGVEKGERTLGGSRGRRLPRIPLVRSRGLVAELVTPEAGLQAVRYEEILNGPRGFLSSSVRLSRRGQSVAFHVEPERAVFAPGSVLYFVSEGSKSNPWGDVVYELEVGKAGTKMPVLVAAPTGSPTTEYLDFKEREENRYYQAGLLDAPDLWLWDLLVSPVTKSYPFTLSQISPSSTSAHLTLRLQGASNFEADPDHHLRVSLNGQVVGEATWDGKVERVIEAEVGPGILQEGSNTLSLENVGDTAAAYSMVFLNRFSLTYPRQLLAEGGLLQGGWNESGTAVVSGLGGAGFVLDVQDTLPQWLRGVEATSTDLSFRAEVGRKYLVVSAASVKSPQVRRPLASRLRNPQTGAEWLLVAPREFLGAAQPLVELRRSQGLKVKAVSLEEVEQEFGYAEHSPSALKEFLEYAYQSWPKPLLRYVVLLGDGSYDPKDYLKTGVKDRISPHIMKTSYLWTASDPAYGAVNGEDLIPDVAVGRLPAGSVEQARVLVDKIVAYEAAGRTLAGRAVLIADNADLGGSFEADADEIASSVLRQREVEKVYLRDLQGGTRATIVAAFDNGPALVSYVGHGGTAVWASENVFNNTDVPSLSAQAQQPLLLTMNCLNGFFHFPPLDSLAEAFLKAEGRGAVAAFSPSGLSVNDAAHLYHKAVLQEIESGRHARLGDAILAAQSTYADSGAMPELLSIYHLFADPALRIR